jgi:hypothetical protein
MNGYGTSPLELIAADAMLREEIYCEWFTYSASFVAGTPQALAAGGQATQQTNIDGDSDFIVQMLNASVFDDDDEFVVSPNMSILIIAAGSGRQIMDAPVPFTNVLGSFGESRFPHQMCFPRLFGSKGTVTTQLLNREGFAPNRVDVNYIGFKVFYTKDKTRQQIFHVL